MKAALEVADLANKFIQDNAIWSKSVDATALANQLFVLLNVIRFVGLLLEPFIPSFSAKLYFIMGVDRCKDDETLIGRLHGAKDYRALLRLLKSGHSIRQPIPLVTPSKLISNRRGRVSNQV